MGTYKATTGDDPSVGQLTCLRRQSRRDNRTPIMAYNNHLGLFSQELFPHP